MKKDNFGSPGTLEVHAWVLKDDVMVKSLVPYKHLSEAVTTVHF